MQSVETKGPWVFLASGRKLSDSPQGSELQSPGKVSYFCVSKRGTGGLAPNWIFGQLSQACYFPGQRQGRRVCFQKEPLAGILH